MDIKNAIKNIISNPSAFFLKNSGTKQTVVKNVSWLFSSMVISKVIKYF